MARLLIRHADVITLDDDDRVLYDTEVAITDGVITAVGEAPPEFEPTDTFDATGLIVTPGMFNAYTHSPMVLFRGRAPARLTRRWLVDPEFINGSGLTSDDVFWAAALAVSEMIRGGVVGFADHYFYMDRVAEVVVQSGIRGNLAWCAFGTEHGEVGADLPGIALFADRWQGVADGRVQTALAPFSPDACSPVFLARTAAVAARLGIGIHLPVAESRLKLDQSLQLFGMTPVEVLDRNGVFDVPTLAAHCSHITESDREILASRGVGVAYCPTYQMRREDGLTPVSALEARGVSVVLGTESPTVAGRLDMLQEVRLATLLDISGDEGAGHASGGASLRRAARDAAHALGFSMSGAIAAGRAADLIFFDRATALPTSGRMLVDIVTNILLSSDVRHVMVAGKWIMRNRNLLTLDEEEIHREAAARAHRLAP